MTGNTMAISVRERTSELAVFKAIGFSDRAVLFFVLAESLIIALIGGLLGLLLAIVAVPALGQGPQRFVTQPGPFAFHPAARLGRGNSCRFDQWFASGIQRHAYARRQCASEGLTVAIP